MLSGDTELNRAKPETTIGLGQMSPGKPNLLGKLLPDRLVVARCRFHLLTDCRWLGLILEEPGNHFTELDLVFGEIYLHRDWPLFSNFSASIQQVRNGIFYFSEPAHRPV